MASRYTATKDPNSTLDYRINWSDWLGVDTIATVAWTVPSGITQTSTTNTTTSATIWLSGGTVGTRYNVVCRITTAGGRIDDRTITIDCVQK